MNPDARPIPSDDLLLRVRQKVVGYWTRNNRREDAEDLAQVGIFHCWQKAHTFKGKKGHNGKKCSFESYLVGVAIKRGLTDLRKERRRAESFSENQHRIEWLARSEDSDSESEDDLSDDDWESDDPKERPYSFGRS